MQTCGAFLKTADNNSQSGTRTTHPSFRRRPLGISVCCHRFCSLCVVFYHLDFAREKGFVSGQNHGSSLKNALEMMMKLWRHGCTSLNAIFQCFEHRQWNSALRILKVILKATKKKKLKGKQGNVVMIWLTSPSYDFYLKERIRFLPEISKYFHPPETICNGVMCRAWINQFNSLPALTIMHKAVQRRARVSNLQDRQVANAQIQT